jgi:hypothetical protein
MRISVNPILDLETLQWLSCQIYDYDGPVLSFKGDKTAQDAESEQLGFMNQMMNVFQAQYGSQKNILDFLTKTMQPQIANPTGYQPQDLAAMRTAASNTVSQEYTKARQAAANAVPGSGSKLAGVAGTTLQTQAAIDAAQAGAETQAQTNIDLANAQLREENRRFATSVLSGTAQQYQPLGFASGVENAGSSISNLSGAITSAAGPTAGQVLGGIAGGAIGAVGNVLSAGFGKGGAWAPVPSQT